MTEIIVIDAEMVAEFHRDIGNAVRAAAGPEIIEAIAHSRAEFHPVWEAMTDEERVNWIIGNG